VDPELRDLLDHKAICDVAIRYAKAIDTHEWDLLDQVFLPDSVADYAGQINDGVAAIKATCSATLGPLDASQHLLGNHEVALDGDRATHRCYFSAQHTKRGVPGGDNWTVAGTYTDDLVRTTDGWRITHRQLRVLWVEGNPSVTGSTRR